MRKITVFSMNDNRKEELTTSSTTWGAVKREKSEINSMVKSDMKIVIKQTKAVIESDDTILPSGDLTIYLFPGKVKSGSAVVVDLSKDIEEQAIKIVNEFIEVIKLDIQELTDVLEEITPRSVNTTPF